MNFTLIYVKFYTRYGQASLAVSDSILLTTSQELLGIREGDLIRGPDGIKVWIVNGYGYKRHIFNPHVLNMYGHLKWEHIKEVPQGLLDSYVTSDLYRAEKDYKVFSLNEIDEARGLAQKRWLDITPEEFIELGFIGFNWKQIFVINQAERDYYQEGIALTKGDL